MSVSRSFAVEGELINEQDIFAEMPVVLSATRLSQPSSSAPAAITVIDRQLIEASGARTIPDILRLVPGMFVAYKSGNKPVVAYHGLSDVFSRRMQVLVDGRSVYVPSFGGVPWVDLPLAIEDIQRIEVIRGPNAASYGANSFLAIISIHTFRGSQVLGDHFTTLYGSHNERKIMWRHAARHKDFDYRVSVSTERDDEFDDDMDLEKTSQLTFRSDYRLTANDLLLFKLGLLHGRRGDGVRSDERERIADAVYGQVRWERKLGFDHDISIQLFHNALDWYENFDNMSLGFPVPVSFDVHSERYDAELQHRFRPTDATRLVWGLNSRVDSAHSGNYYGIEDRVTYRLNRIFANLEWFIRPSLSLNIGAMQEDNSFTGSDFSPRLAVNYTVAPGHTVRAIYSQATRVPSTIEEQADGKICILRLDPSCTVAYRGTVLGDPNLRVERITSHELGYYAQLRRNLFVDVKVFRDQISDLVSIDSEVEPRTFSNTDDVMAAGVEIQADFRPSPFDRLFLGASYLDIDSDDVGDNYSTSAPSFAATFLALHRFTANVEGSVVYYHLDAYHPLDGREMDGTSRTDVKLARGFRVPGLRGKIALIGQAVEGDYLEYQPGNIFQRRVYAQLELDF